MSVSDISYQNRMTQKLSKHLTLLESGFLSRAGAEAVAAQRSDSMAPLTGAAKAAVEDFFAGRRGKSDPPAAAAPACMLDGPHRRQGPGGWGAGGVGVVSA